MEILSTSVEKLDKKICDLEGFVKDFASSSNPGKQIKVPKILTVSES